MKDFFKSFWQPELENPSLIVGWNRDAAGIAPKVIDFLNEKIGGKTFEEINPAGFFSLRGVTIEDDIIQFPESKFYCGQRKDLVIFKSDEPRYQRYQFLNTVLDVAANYCKIRELYTLSGKPSYFSHTTPRRISAVFNQLALKKKLKGYGLENMTWEGRPAISSYLLWIAKRRGIAGVSLWPEIPFYLATSEDPQAMKLTLSFLDKRFNLGLDLEEFDLEIRKQNIKIARLRVEHPEINKSIKFLESGLSLNEEEQLKLAQEIYQLLKKRG